MASRRRHTVRHSKASLVAAALLLPHTAAGLVAHNIGPQLRHCASVAQRTTVRRYGDTRCMEATANLPPPIVPRFSFQRSGQTITLPGLTLGFAVFATAFVVQIPVFLCYLWAVLFDKQRRRYIDWVIHFWAWTVSVRPPLCTQASHPKPPGSPAGRRVPVRTQLFREHELSESAHALTHSLAGVRSLAYLPLTIDEDVCMRAHMHVYAYACPLPFAVDESVWLLARGRRPREPRRASQDQEELLVRPKPRVLPRHPHPDGLHPHADEVRLLCAGPLCLCPALTADH